MIEFKIPFLKKPPVEPRDRGRGTTEQAPESVKGGQVLRPAAGEPNRPTTPPASPPASSLPAQPQPQPQPKKVQITQVAQSLGKGRLTVKDIIAPPAMEVDFDHIKVGEMYYRTLYVAGYPRFVGANWLSPIINFDHTLEISMFYYPVESRGVLEDMRRKIAEMEATIQESIERGRVVDPQIQAALEDARSLQEQLVKGVERFFQFSFYITIPAKTLDELDRITKQVESTLGSLLLLSKHATLRMEEAFSSTVPLCVDKLQVLRNMDTTSIATTFPFTSSELTANEGILYGINEHNGSLIIFDRFSLENANSVVFAKSGAGKSYLVKLEALRQLIFGTEIIVIDPEKEYENLASAIGGEFITFSPHSQAKINPFDLSGVYEEGENELSLKILALHTILKVMMGELNASEEALLDRALILTYQKKGITQDPQTHTKEPPVMKDLYDTLLEVENGKPMANRLEQYVLGSLAGIFDQPTTIDIKNTFTVFSTRDLEDAVRPAAMQIILDFVWTRIRRELKKRILIVDEAWYLMQHEESAKFMYSISKRARKYYLGLTTVTQDVGDFLHSEYGKAIVTNSSIQILLRQHPAAIEEVTQTFYLSEGEKRFLLSAAVGQGLFFAGPNHVAMQVVSSEQEHPLATSSPREILEFRGRQPVSKDQKGQSEPASPNVDEKGPAPQTPPKTGQAPEEPRQGGVTGQAPEPIKPEHKPAHPTPQPPPARPIPPQPQQGPGPTQQRPESKAPAPPQRRDGTGPPPEEDANPNFSEEDQDTE